MEERLNTRVPESGIESIFTRESKWSAWMEVEVALAQAEADLGLIPKEAAAKIGAVAKYENICISNVEKALEVQEHSLMPLIDEISRLAGESAGGYVHWGATTQNVTQTGFMLLCRQAHIKTVDLLAALLRRLAKTAEKTKGYVMAGRTHGQQALPLTFGYKVAMWIDELSRHGERLLQCQPRFLVGMVGGGAGTFASLGGDGRAVQDRMCEILGLASMPVPGRSIQDHITEYVLVLVMLGTTLGKIAREIREHMKQEYGEVEEPVPGESLGSSTMPQKRNPKLCMEIIFLETRLRSVMAMAVEGMLGEHEADGSRTAMTGHAIVTAFEDCCAILSTTVVIFTGLRIFPQRMLENIDLSDGMLASERVMLELGRKIGRQDAHHIVHELCTEAALSEDLDLETLLNEDDQMSELFSPAEISELLDPSKYTGQCAEMAIEQVGRGLQMASDLTAARKLLEQRVVPEKATNFTPVKESLTAARSSLVKLRSSASLNALGQAAEMRRRSSSSDMPSPKLAAAGPPVFDPQPVDLGPSAEPAPEDAAVSTLGVQVATELGVASLRKSGSGEFSSGVHQMRASTSQDLRALSLEGVHHE